MNDTNAILREGQLSRKVKLAPKVYGAKAGLVEISGYKWTQRVQFDCTLSTIVALAAKAATINDGNKYRVKSSDKPSLQKRNAAELKTRQDAGSHTLVVRSSGLYSPPSFDELLALAQGGGLDDEQRERLLAALASSTADDGDTTDDDSDPAVDAIVASTKAHFSAADGRE